MRFPIVAFFMMALTGVSIWAAAPPEPTPDRVQRYQIVDYSMTVPVGYLSLTEKMFEGGPDDTIRQNRTYGNLVHLIVEYPGFGAPSAYKRHIDHKVDAQYDLFDFNLNPFPGGQPSTVTKSMAELRVSGKCLARKVFDRCPDWHRPEHSDREAFYLGDGDNFVFCTIAGTVPAPHCNMEQILIDEIIISIRFHRRYLDDVLAIRDGVFARACSWLNLPAERTYTVDYCK